MKKLSKHSVERINERIQFDFNTERNLFKSACKRGKVKENYSGEFYDFLFQKSLSGVHIKIYNNYIFIISKNKKKLITVYPVPEIYLPIEQFEISNNKSNILYFINKFKNKEIKILIDNQIKVKGFIVRVLGYSYAELIIFRTLDGLTLYIDTSHISYIVEHFDYDITNIA